MTEEMAGKSTIDKETGGWPKSYGSTKSSSDELKIHSEYANYKLKLPLSYGEGYTRIPDSSDDPPRLYGIKSSWLFGLYVAFYVFYLVSGGLVFSALEAPIENQVKQALLRSRNEFLRIYPSVDGKYKFKTFLFM